MKKIIFLMIALLITACNAQATKDVAREKTIARAGSVAWMNMTGDERTDIPNAVHFSKIYSNLYPYIEGLGGREISLELVSIAQPEPGEKMLLRVYPIYDSETNYQSGNVSIRLGKQRYMVATSSNRVQEINISSLETLPDALIVSPELRGDFIFGIKKIEVVALK